MSLLLSGWNGARFHGQVSVQRSVWLDCVQDQPRSAEHQRPGGDHQGKMRRKMSTCKIDLMLRNYNLNFTAYSWKSIYLFPLRSCPSVCLTFLALRTLRTTALSSFASTLPTSAFSITSISTSLSSNRSVDFGLSVEECFVIELCKWWAHFRGTAFLLGLDLNSFSVFIMQPIFQQHFNLFTHTWGKILGLAYHTIHVHYSNCNKLEFAVITCATG